MKLIKCRAWFEDEMIYSNCDIADYIFEFNLDGELCFNIWNDELHKLTPDGDVTFSGWDEYTKNIMLFTNFCDTNNTEIYVGDIVKFTAFGMVVCGVVEWDVDDGLPGFVIVDTDGSGTIWSFLYNDMNIIGNIHKNPELLKLS